nr:small proline-rich protein 2B [Drosophila kikkawai]
MSNTGKINSSCPCGTTGGAPIAPSHRPPPAGCQQQDYQQAPSSQTPAGCQLPPQQIPQRPQVECCCAQNRVRNVRPQPAIQADVIHCCRPPPVQAPPPDCPRCSCRDNIPPPQPKPCTCTPLQPKPQPCNTTHVHMPCPQSHRGGPVPYQRPVPACAHCRSQNKGAKKKCVIQ